MTREERRSRQRLRMEAAEWFDRGEKSSMIAMEFGVHVRSVEKWRRDWRDGGAEALRSQGNGAATRLSDAEFAALEAVLADGPMPHGWADQKWTLSRIAAVIERMFQVTYTIQGVRKLLLRHGYSRHPGGWQSAGPHLEAVTGWVKGTRPTGAPTATAAGAHRGPGPERDGRVCSGPDGSRACPGGSP
ncbi:transposase [Streptomyces mirabilis]|uniref:helix-turn-helix domain-containing protein n=1 Tax=Streptomyces mirabilis TaxID=68239 RepID=UPI0036BFA0CF